MPQCQTALVINQEMDIKAALNQLSRATFNAEHAVQCKWGHNQFVVDNGMNNIRTVVDSKKGLILFHCRYPQYIGVVESLLTEFIAEQGLCMSSYLPRIDSLSEGYLVFMLCEN